MRRRAFALVALVFACGGSTTNATSPGPSAGPTAGPPAAGTAVAVSTEPEGTARIDPDAVRSVIHAAHAHFLLCYAAGLKKKKDLAGRVETKFVIDETGHVISADDVTHSNVLPDDDVRACIVSKFRNLEFPPPKPSGKVPITYPLLLDPSMVMTETQATSAPTRDDYEHGRAPFDRAATAHELSRVDVHACPGFRGIGHVTITFDPSGVPTKTNVDSPAGISRAARACVEKAFAAVRIPVYEGDAVTVGKSFHVP